MRTSALCLLVSVAAGTLAAADPAYFGKWKLNPVKSDFKGVTLTISRLPSGEMQFSGDGQSYNFKVDGQERPAIYGLTAAWKQIDANTWDTVYKLNGKVANTSTTKLSADGKTMTTSSKIVKPDGSTFDETGVFERVSGGPGLPGKYKATEVKTSVEMIEISPDGSDGLTLNFIDFQATAKAKFDGKDYPLTGPTVPPGFTVAIRKAGAGGFNMTERQNGKDLFMLTFTVSADGKTLTEAGTAAGVKEPFKAVYDRQ
jgi:hypothetical protein